MKNNYWREQYGSRSPEFIEGVIAGVTGYAVWENGSQVVGIRHQPLNEVRKEIRDGLK